VKTTQKQICTCSLAGESLSVFPLQPRRAGALGAKVPHGNAGTEIRRNSISEKAQHCRHGRSWNGQEMHGWIRQAWRDTVWTRNAGTDSQGLDLHGRDWNK